MMMDDKNEKWSCRKCTFLNWPKSIKCSICLTSRSTYFIDEELDEQSKDIFKITPLIVNNEKNSIYSYSKWLCPTCTYLNWPKSTKCIQCLTVHKVKISPTRSSSPSSSTFNNCKESLSSRDFSLPLVNSNSLETNLTSTSSPSSSDKYYNDRNLAFSYSNFYQKWACPACTYENWPRALKCNMCLTSKFKSINSGSENQSSLSLTTSSDDPFRNSPSPPGAKGGSF